MSVAKTSSTAGGVSGAITRSAGVVKGLPDRQEVCMTAPGPLVKVAAATKQVDPNSFSLEDMISLLELGVAGKPSLA